MAKNKTRLTRLGDFWPIGRLFSLGSFFITEVWQIIMLLFMQYKLSTNFDQEWVGLHFGLFLRTHLVTLP
jgi:hypothetical protein